MRGLEPRELFLLQLPITEGCAPDCGSRPKFHCAESDAFLLERLRQEGRLQINECAKVPRHMHLRVTPAGRKAVRIALYISMLPGVAA